MLRSNEDVEMRDVEDEEDDEDEVISELDPDEGLLLDAYPLFKFYEPTQSQVMIQKMKMKTHLNPFPVTAIHNSPWATKATGHTSFVGTTSECSITPPIIQ